jgi:hypothetical protein
MLLRGHFVHLGPLGRIWPKTGFVERWDFFVAGSLSYFLGILHALVRQDSDGDGASMLSLEQFLCG